MTVHNCRKIRNILILEVMLFYTFIGKFCLLGIIIYPDRGLCLEGFLNAFGLTWAKKANLWAPENLHIKRLGGGGAGSWRGEEVFWL